MTRKKIIVAAVTLACVLGLLPPTFLYFYTLNSAIQTEQRHLAQHADWITKNAQEHLADMAGAIREVEAKNFHDCSDQHIQAMRNAVMAHRSVELIAFYADGKVACTAWGVATSLVPREPIDYRTSEGLGVHIRPQAAAIRGFPAIAVERGNHVALVNPELLIDIPEESQEAIALANREGRIITSLNNPAPDIVRKAIADGSPGKSKNMLYASSKSEDWMTVVTEDRHFVDRDFRRQRFVMLPLGLVMTAGVVLLVFWVMRRRLTLQADLQEAIQKRKLIVFYQPIVDLRTGKCAGAEALLRWKGPEEQFIPPDRFIPIAEESGLIYPITDLVLENVFRDMSGLLQSNGFHVAVNLCAADIETGRPLPLLERLLKEHHVSAKNIWLEATERAFIHPDQARQTLKAARDKGFSVLIDDFGTGYSSLSLLHTLPLDILKIDKSFIDSIGTDSPLGLVIPHIIKMAEELQLDLIAEGVEKQEQVDYCRIHGIRYAQGWLFAKAMDPQNFHRWFAAHQAARRKYHGAD